MWRAGLVAALLCAASAVSAQCQPSGREQFAAGLSALDRGDLTAAAGAFEALVKEQPTCPGARNNLAVVLVEQGRLRDAAEQLRRALELQPDYHRARLNLERVDTLLLAQQPPPPPPPAPQAAARATPVVEVEPLRAPQATPTAPTDIAPANIAALEPAGTTACVIEPAANRICVYRRTADGITRDECYALLSVRVRPEVRWLTASDLTARRMRLVDETGHKRLKVTGEAAAPGNDVVRVREADFTALAARVAPWRTGWVVVDRTSDSHSDGARVAAEVRDAIERWRRAWEEKQFATYVSLYGASFVPPSEPDRAHWLARKRQLFEQSAPISVQLQAPSIFLFDDGATAVATFEQAYRSGSTGMRTTKALRWQRVGDRWTISAETVLTETAEHRR